MGVGRNLAYTATLYYAHNGFMKHIKIPSGDDDLFVNQVATKENTAICFAAEGFTYSIPKKSFKTWIHQKKRHITTARFYKPKHKVLLGLYYLANVLFWGTAIVSLFLLDFKIALSLFTFRVLIQWFVFAKSAIQLDEKDLIKWIPLLDIFLLLIQFGIFVSNIRSKPTHWK
jgi:hypothetical protein